MPDLDKTHFSAMALYGVVTQETDYIGYQSVTNLSVHCLVSGVNKCEDSYHLKCSPAYYAFNCACALTDWVSWLVLLYTAHFKADEYGNYVGEFADGVGHSSAEVALSPKAQRLVVIPVQS